MSKKYAPRIDERWIRHDWRMWVRPDIARWMKPGVDPADVIPALAHERAQQEAKRAREEAAWAAEDAAFAAELDDLRRGHAAICEAVKELKADIARWRRRVAEEEAKYSPSQPRVPAGNSRGGQWTQIGGGEQIAGPGPSQDTGQATGSSFAEPMGNVGIGDVSGSSELGDLFQIKPDEPRAESVPVAGDVIRVCIVIGAGRATVDGVKTFSVIYECAGGRTFRREGFGHNFPGIVRDPFR